MEKFDLIIIGAGPGGYTAAEKALESGISVAVIERDELGGTCVNRGCIPTKAIIHAADVYSNIKNSRRFGIQVSEVSYNSERVYEYKDSAVLTFRQDVEEKFQKLGIRVIRGEASLLPYKCVRVSRAGEEDIELTAEKIILAVGAKPILPDIEGIDLPGVVTSDELLSTETDKYEDVIIIGGGVVGIESANILHGFGCHVTILESGEQILAPMDPEISENLSEFIKLSGVVVETGAKPLKITKEGGRLICHYTQKGIENQVTAGHILIAIGRRSVIDEVLAPGVELQKENGKVVLDSNFETSIPGVYAIGDATEGIKLAHVAAAQGTFVVEYMLKKEPSIMLSIVPSCLFIDLPLVPSCIYLSPEIASVGLSEAEAKERGLNVRCGKYDLSKNGKAIISDERVGFIKVVFEATSDVLIGAQMICTRATDMIGEMATAIANSLTSRMLLYAMRAHPTYSEAVARAVEDSQKQN